MTTAAPSTATPAPARTPIPVPSFVYALPYTFIRVRLRLIAPLLGTVPKNRAVYSAFQAGKIQKGVEEQRKLASRMGIAPAAAVMPSGFEPAVNETAAGRAAEEESMIVEEDGRGWTGFLQDRAGMPCISSHMIIGYLSAQAQTFKDSLLKDLGCGHIKQIKNRIKVGVSVDERFISFPPQPKDYDPKNPLTGHPYLLASETGPVCERSLRAQTPQGDRVTVVRSDVILAGHEFEFTLRCLPGQAPPPKLIGAMFGYGRDIQGLGQWRSSKEFGRFEVIKFCGWDPARGEFAFDDRGGVTDEDIAAATAPKKPRGKKAAEAAKTVQVAAGGDRDDGDDEE